MRGSPLLLLAAVVAAGSCSPTEPAVVCSGAATTPTGEFFYVANTGNRITVYSTSDTGNAAPTATIAGSNTGLSFPWGITRDTAGRLYVVNLGTSGASPETVTVYAANAVGNVAPIRTIGGSNTALHHVEGIAVDDVGQLYVENDLIVSNVQHVTITVYAPGAFGNVAPTRTIGGSAGLSGAPMSLAVDHACRLYVAN